MEFILDTEQRKAEFNSIFHLLRRSEHVSRLKIEKNMVLLQLIQSLRFDGRFYGAEWNYYPLEELEGILAPYIPKDRYIDPVEEIRQIRDADYYDV